MADSRLIWIVLSASIAACGAAPAESNLPSPRGPPEPGPPPPAATELDAGGWGRATSARQSLELALPDRASWSIDDTETWFVARHDRTRSELSARVWRAGRLVRPSECEKQARLWNPAIPAIDSESVLETRRVDAPAGWSTELTVGVGRVGTGPELRGYAVGFGVTVGRCYAFVYTTLASGAGAEASVGQRLAIVVDEIVPQVRVRSIDERVR